MGLSRYACAHINDDLRQSLYELTNAYTPRESMRVIITEAAVGLAVEHPEVLTEVPTKEAFRWLVHRAARATLLLKKSPEIDDINEDGSGPPSPLHV